eukprot:GHVR01013775.1.p1 GENE.GHVR01013775.1~~GHVR01013775.1.p1  ORF type:complete len:100 (+),score=20.05 GHVR01013775.1:294-593(+)
MDLASGFWQMPVTEADKFKTAFATRGDGHHPTSEETTPLTAAESWKPAPKATDPFPEVRLQQTAVDPEAEPKQPQTEMELSPTLADPATTEEPQPCPTT